MVQFIGKNSIFAPNQGCDHTDIGHITGGKQQGLWKTGKLRQRIFQTMMRGRMTMNEMRCPCPHTVLLRAFADGLDQIRMIGQSQIIIAAECQIVTAVNGDVSCLRAFDNLPETPQPLLLAGMQLFSQI